MMLLVGCWCWKGIVVDFVILVVIFIIEVWF